MVMTELENAPLPVQPQSSASRYLPSLVTYSHWTPAPPLENHSVPLSAALRLGLCPSSFPVEREREWRGRGGGVRQLVLVQPGQWGAASLPQSK